MERLLFQDGRNTCKLHYGSSEWVLYGWISHRTGEENTKEQTSGRCYRISESHLEIHRRTTKFRTRRNLVCQWAKPLIIKMRCWDPARWSTVGWSLQQLRDKVQSRAPRALASQEGCLWGRGGILDGQKTLTLSIFTDNCVTYFLRMDRIVQFLPIWSNSFPKWP